MGNQRDHFPCKYILIRLMMCLIWLEEGKVMGYMKYLIRSVKLSAEAVEIWTEENWGVNRVN